MSDPIANLGLSPVINAVGYATRVGGSRPSPAVLEAMMHANRACFEIDDLQAAAWKLIAETTGAEAGIITCGAAAGLTLSAAACLAGNDPAIMDRLPDTTGLARREIIYPILGTFDYDHPIRLSGANLIDVDYEADDALAHIEAAICSRTAAVGYVWLRMNQRPSLRDVLDIAHRRNLPVIMDAAFSLPPAGHLRQFAAEGVDLATFSGGKHLGGPQASGLLLGKANLIRSAWVQMADMDVRAETWSLRHWIDQGWITRPPRHGIGRSMKVGKEAIVGLMTALREFTQRDHEVQYQAWHARIQRIAAGLAGLPNLTCTALDRSLNGQPFPCIELRSPRMTDILRKLRSRSPRVILGESETDRQVAVIYPMCLTDEEAIVLVNRFREA